MRRNTMVNWTTVAICAALAGACPAGEPEKPAAAGRRFLALYDTGKPAQLGDTVPALPAEGWTQVGKDEKRETFRGDAVLLNNKLAAVVRADGGGVELFAKGEGGWHRRAKLAGVVGSDVAKMETVAAAPGDGTFVAVEAKLAGAAGTSIVFGMKAGEPILKAAPKGEASALRLSAPCRLGVLPDFFADDFLIDARLLTAEQAEIPSDNIFLHLTGNGGTIVAALWEKNEKDLRVNLSGEGEGRVMDSTDVFFGSKGGGVWVAVLEQKGIWYSRNFTREEGINGVVMTDWEVPFTAKWKGNFTREDKRTESVQFAPGRYKGLERKRGKLQAVLGRKSRMGAQERDQNPKAKGYVGLEGVGAVYPITRTEDTPPAQLCMDDLLRLCLGTGPCEYVLDLAARKPVSKGIFTCSYGGTMGRIFPVIPGEERMCARRVKDERCFVRRINRNMLTFVKNVQDRTDGYVDFGLELLAYLEEQEKKHPDQAAFIERVRAEWAIPVGQYARPKILKNTEKLDNEKRAMKYAEDFYKALRVDTPAQMKKGLAGVRNIPHNIGDPGDRRLRNLRRKVKVLRAMATMEMAMNPGAAGIAAEIRKRSEAALRNPHSYEKVTVW
jgi:hypothetical protein